MNKYHFGDKSVISEVAFVKSEGGGVRAYLFANELAEPEKLNAIKNKIQSSNMQCIPVIQDGKAALEVRECGRKPKKLLELLALEKAIDISPEIEKSPKKAGGFFDSIKKNALQLSGISYFIGDMGFLAYGVKEAFEDKKLVKPQILVTGLLYALGTQFLIWFGMGDKSDFQVRKIAHNVVEDLKNRGVEHQMENALHQTSAKHEGGILKTISNFCSVHTSELMNASFATAGIMNMWSSIKDLRNAGSIRGKTPVLIDILLGFITLGSGTISTLIPEEPHDKNKPKRTGLAGIWDSIKEKPLRISGIGYSISTILHGIISVIELRDAHQALKDPHISAQDKVKNQNAVSALPLRMLFVVSALTAEVVMSFASKGHGNGVKTDKSLDNSVYAVMADFILHNPPEKQPELLARVSMLLAHKKNLGDNVQVIEQGILAQMQAMQKNPWANSKANVEIPANQPEVLLPSPIIPPTISKRMPVKAPVTGWQNREAALKIVTNTGIEI